MKAFFNYYLTINSINLPASVLIAIFGGVYWLPIAFCTFGLAMGLFAYSIFFKNQYYFYYNLGYTKLRLALMVLSFNSVIAVVLFLLLLLF